ncbi:MAG TPA: alpha/beta fold hydrolase [Thermoanaerobaculia bacterium]|nr:alpha/beta fold hydrolase [Thermoanaerobaculia bacterium]
MLVSNRFAFVVAASLLGSGLPVVAQELTLERIMADPDWLGRAPEEAWWADDGGSVFYERKREGEEARDLFEVGVGGEPIRRVEDAERGTISVPGGDWSRDRTRKVFAREGDVYLRDLATGELRQLTRTAAAESDPFFMAGETRVAFRRGDAFLVRDLASGLESQPAEVLAEKDPAEAEDEEEDEEGYLARQEEKLFEIVRRSEAEERAERERRLAERAADPTRVPPPWYLGDDVEVTGAHLSPAGDRLLVTVAPKEREEGKRDLMPSYVTETGYVLTEEVRPKVGTGDGRGERLLLLDLAAREERELDWQDLPGFDEDPLAELRAAAEGRKEAEERERPMKRPSSASAGAEGEKAEARAEQAEEAEEELEGAEVVGEEEAVEIREGEEDEQELREEGEAEEDEDGLKRPSSASAGAGDGAEDEEDEDEPELRQVQVGPVLWNDDGTRVAAMVFSLDNKDRWIATVDLEEGRLVSRHRLHDPGWINWDFNEMGWLADGETLWYLSEEDGYSHLYLVPAAGGPARRLTEGRFAVSDVTLSPDGGHLYFRANREHPGIWEVYRVPVAEGSGAGGLERVTRLDDYVEYVLSPDGERLLLRHSSAVRPPELYVQPAGPAPGGAAAEPGAGERPVRLTETVSAEYAGIGWRAPELVAVPSRHGAPGPVHARLYLPDGFDPERPERYPAVVFIHGAGYLQDVFDGWSYYFREHMFHELLARRGYVVLDLDYRGSAGYGRDWRTAIYRRMGHPELEDLADGAAWLAATKKVDPERVGVYGGSYGGFLTLMALFREPGLFAAGAALRPVTDWAHYNHPYTSNILNTPELDPEAYERSSPIEHAEGLADPLVMIHGMQDDNVLFQDTVRLAQRLIELGKQDWWVAMYPIEAHAFEEPSSWLDAYRRILKLFETEVRESR